MGNATGRGLETAREEERTGDGTGRRLGMGREEESLGRGGDNLEMTGRGETLGMRLPQKKKQLEKLNNDNYISLSNSELG